jgi:hypothetical protein
MKPAITDVELKGSDAPIGVKPLAAQLEAGR